MPPVVIDLRGADDSRDVVHIAVQALAEGKIVAFPTETVYLPAASGLSEQGVARLEHLQTHSPSRPLILAVKSADDALDYVPRLCPLGHRLARRCWPGPVTLVTEDRDPDSLVRCLSPAVQQVVAPRGSVGLRVPAHPLIHEVMRLLAGPVVMGSAGAEGSRWTTAQEVIEALGDQVDLVLDDGRSRFGQPSSIVRVRQRDFEIVQPGVVTEQTLRRLASTMVLFVCTGNTCRSPMAEVMFRSLVAEQLGCSAEEVEDRGFIIMSAGIAAMLGGGPSAEAVDVMAERQIDLKNHESQPLSEQLVRHADLVLAMTQSHREAILAEWPEASDRVKLLCENGTDVSDPVGGPPQRYRQCADQIRQQLAKWVDKVTRSNNDEDPPRTSSS